MRVGTWQARVLVVVIALAIGVPTAHAGYNGVAIEGVDDARVASGSISIPGIGTRPLVTAHDCEEDPEDECPPGFGFYIKTDADLTDGTQVTIRLTDPDGRKTTGTGNVTSAGIRTSVSPFPVPDSTSDWTRPRGIRFGGGPGTAETASGSGGLGTVILGPGLEPRIAFAPDSIDGTAFYVDVEPGPSIRFGERDWRWVFGLRLYDGDDESGRSIQNGTDPVALTYWRPAPNSSTGLGLGNTGADVWIFNDLEYRRGNIELNTPKPLFKGTFARLGVNYVTAEQTIRGQFTSPTFTGPGIEISATTHQTIEERGFSVYAGLDRPFVLSQSIRFKIGGFLQPGIQRTELTGRMNTMCEPCAVDEQALQFDLSEDDTNFNIGAGMQAGFDFDLTEKLTLEVSATAYWNSKIGVADNPQNPAEGEARLDTDSVFGVVGQAGLRVNF